jgi:hypothetical protein
MRSCGPAGWSSHGYYGFTAKTFGNPMGATSGDGRWDDANTDQLPPNARRDSGGHTTPPAGNNWTGYSGLNIGSTGLYGGGDDGFWDSAYGDLTGAGGNGSTSIPADATLGGAQVVGFAFTSSDWNGDEAIIVAVFGTVLQNVWTSLTFSTVAHPTPVTYLSADAQAFSHVEPPGYTVWSFAPVNAFPFGEGPDPITVTVV